MEDLRKQLASLDADQVKELLSASGHVALLADLQQRHDAIDVAAVKAHGNERFKAGEFDEAVRAYTQCIDATGGGDATLFANRAMANLKLQRYEEVIKDCSAALSITSSIKPYLRRAAAFVALDDAQNALSDLDTALSFEPNNPDAMNLLSQIVKHTQSDRRTRVKAALLLSFREGWKTLAVKGNPSPPGLNGHVLFTLPCDPRQRIYLFGGRAVRDQKANVYVMDEIDYSWELASISGVLPPSRAWHSMCPVSDDTLCLYGGVSANGEDPRLHLLRASHTPSGFTLTWVNADDGNQTPSIPLPRSGHSALSLSIDENNRSILIFGGRTKEGVNNELWIVSIDSGIEVSRVKCDDSNSPPPRDGHSMVLWSRGSQHHIIIFGGNGQRTEEKMNDVWMLDISTWKWSSIATSGEIPPARSYHSAHVIEDFMFVVGGRMTEAEDGDVYVLDLVLREWFRVPFPPNFTLRPRAWHASIMRKERKEIYLIGGGTFNGPLREAAVLGIGRFIASIDQITTSIS